MATLFFLVLGGVGVVVLAVALLGGEWHVWADGPVSLEVVAGFLGAFGFAGAIAAELTGSPAPATIIGLAAAVPVAWLTLRLSRAARTMPTDATPRRQDLIGTLGVIVTPVPAGAGFGEVRVVLGGQPVKLYARARQAIGAGAHVFVVEAPSDTSVVVEETPNPGKA
jgi:membrane protein implicated in regulation of membrane protease activity